MKFRAFCIVALSILCACQAPQMIDMRGRTNQNFVDELTSKNSPNSVIQIMSGGGNINAAYLASKNIIENNNKVLIYGHCFSSCAEYFLGAASEVTFLDRPIVGFHWNTLMNMEQMERNGGDLSNCDLTSVAQQREIYEHKNLNTDFWKETEKRLNLTYFEVIENPDGCPFKKRVFENYMWFPTSMQLGNLLNLKFKGGVCSDSPKICQRRIDRRWKSGTRVIIGDDLYVSKGWQWN